MKAGLSALLAAATAASILLAAPRVSADPSVWARARRPDMTRRLDLITQAEQLHIKHRHLLRHAEGRDAAVLGRVYLRHAAELLEEAGARTSTPGVRMRLALVYHQLDQPEKAVPLLESIVRARPEAAAPLLAEAWTELAICYARLGRHDEEIKAYARALSLEPHPSSRAMLLANRAEAYMVTGDISAAVAGYRSALALLASPMEMARFAPTTLWGLAVAFDRSGDLDAGLDAIRLARTYDSRDERINGPGWFYVPPYDKHWYAALGHWAVARKTDLGMIRAEAYARAVSAWEEYIASAAPNDKWIAIARARHRQCQKERDTARKASLKAKPPSRGGQADAD